MLVLVLWTKMVVGFCWPLCLRMSGVAQPSHRPLHPLENDPHPGSQKNQQQEEGRPVCRQPLAVAHHLWNYQELLQRLKPHPEMRSACVMTQSPPLLLILLLFRPCLSRTACHWVHLIGAFPEWPVPQHKHPARQTQWGTKRSGRVWMMGCVGVRRAASYLCPIH